MDTITKNIILTPFNILYRIDPRLTLEILFRLKMGQKLHLDDPKTFNEKLQWIKLYDKNPLMPICCDKYTVRRYVEDKGYGYILNDLIWHGYDPEKIPFDDLPDKCVIKATHGSTFNIISNNRAEVISKCRRWLKTKYLPCYGEWFYGVVPPRIIIEKYLGDNLFDYKIFCFNGEPKLVYVDTWRNGHMGNIFDIDMNPVKGVQIGYPNDPAANIKKPEKWDEMVGIARKLSEDFLHVRVDLYYTQGRIYFGELTFTRGAGFGKIEPLSFDYEIGSWLDLHPDK